MNVVDLDHHRLQGQQQRELEQEEAFREYAALAVNAQASLNMSDGIAAGKAWGRFVRLFCNGAQQ